MAANIEEVIVSARTFSNVLALPVSGKIGDIDIETTLEEIHERRLHVTEHPVESGASITDHSFTKPAELVLRCGWSNASLKALFGIISGFFAGGTMTRADYVSGVYSRLLKLQEDREPISIVTSLRQYDNMLITSLQVQRDQKTSQVLMCTATCREVIIVNTAAATLPAKESQATPANTAEVENAGAKQPVEEIPAPGGSVPPNEW